MTASGSSSSASTFHSDEIEIPERPTHTVTLAGREITARSPKMKTWMDTGFMLERLEQARTAQNKLSTASLTMTAAERRELEEAASDGPPVRELHFTVLHFLEACLPSADTQAVLDAYQDEDRDDVDVPQMYDVAFELYSAFEPWFTERAQQMGMTLPQADPQQAREAAEGNRASRRAASSGSGGGARRR
ncbi:hypothetical protein IL38_24095 [Actinopolyspora erythraea]|uniref:Tail assembly chaperone n=1 Tax=Actinopolyspora erythraea TaxID=414996 RepID=A0ABR4WYH4_9ACTN|nr:hypothetical protein [Actinopolyspora erythraea]KGI79381.1 hypothetical protein IL38_24095 [Actinopolyspora erythraea]